MRPYAAFLRGVSPVNAKMGEVKAAFEAAGFERVRTVLSSGNVVFHARAAREATLEERAEAAMARHLHTAFPAVVRPIEALLALLEKDPFQGFHLEPGAKRVVTFLQRPQSPAPALPVELDGARILALEGKEAFSAYLPSPRGPVFMTLIEKTFGRGVTTRTWETLKKVVAAANP